MRITNRQPPTKAEQPEQTIRRREAAELALERAARVRHNKKQADVVAYEHHAMCQDYSGLY